MSAYSNEEMEVYLRELFKIGDVNGDGVLSKAELSRLLALSGFAFDEKQVGEVMERADVNKDGKIQLEEFIPMMLSLGEGMSKEDGKEATSVLMKARVHRAHKQRAK